MFQHALREEDQTSQVLRQTEAIQLYQWNSLTRLSCHFLLAAFPTLHSDAKLCTRTELISQRLKQTKEHNQMNFPVELGATHGNSIQFSICLVYINQLLTNPSCNFRNFDPPGPYFHGAMSRRSSRGWLGAM